MKMFCKNMKCLKASDYDSVMLTFCPFCGQKFTNISNPGVNADKGLVSKPKVEPKIDSSRLPFFKKNSVSKQNLESDLEDDDDGIPIEIPNVSSADIKFDVGHKQTIGSFLKNGEAPQIMQRSAEAQEVLNKDLQNMLAQAKQLYPQSTAKISRPVKTKVAAKKKK